MSSAWSASIDCGRQFDEEAQRLLRPLIDVDAGLFQIVHPSVDSVGHHRRHRQSLLNKRLIAIEALFYSLQPGENECEDFGFAIAV